MWDKYFLATNIEDVVELLAKYKGQVKIIAGGTDLVLELERSLHKTQPIIVDISRINHLNEIFIENDEIHIGALVTHNQVVKSPIIQLRATCLAEACYQVGSPQIRNRGTVAGNLVTASPANDTITPLVALDAEIVLVSMTSERRVKIRDFYTGVRKTKLREDEILKEIIIHPSSTSFSAFYKLALRNAQAISVVNAAICIDVQENVVKFGKVAVGAVAPTIVRLNQVEAYILGKNVSELDSVDYSSFLSEISPISDIRSMAAYRSEMVNTSIRRCFEKLKHTQAGKNSIPLNPISLEGKATEDKKSNIEKLYLVDQDHPIETMINGKQFVFHHSHEKTLLRLIREDAGLIGTKEGCDEGECGACTVFLDGKAIMSCLVPAPRAHHADIQTIESLSSGERLHAVQQAFIDEGAVQCGYCTPGFIMSAVKLLEEVHSPDQEQIKAAITGNLCRCTGYYKIIKAIEKAAEITTR